MLIVDFKDVREFFNELLTDGKNFYDDGTVHSNTFIYLELFYLDNQLCIVPAYSVAVNKEWNPERNGISIKHYFNHYNELFNFVQSEKNYDKICEEMLHEYKLKLQELKMNDINEDFKCV